MSNYSPQESEKATSKISHIEVKVKPKNFDDIKNKSATIDYVNQVINKFTDDVNNTFVTQLNSLFTKNTKRMLELSTDSLETTNKLISLSSKLSNSIETNNQNYETLRREFDDLKSEVEKSKISGDTIDEWHVPANDMF